MEIVEHLTQRIGARWAGGESNLAACGYLADRFSSLGLEVETQDFPFVGWRPTRSPCLEFLEPESLKAAVALMEFSGSTPPQGVEGMLEEAGLARIVPGFLEWPRYALVTEGGVAGYLVVHVGLAGWQAPPIPLMNPEPFFPYPMAVLSEADHRRIQRWKQGGKQVRARLTVQAQLRAPLWGHNVLATLGRTIEEDSARSGGEILVFCAHLDTAYATPGANNNAGGLQALHDLAARLCQMRERRIGYQFLACDACEWGFLGSRHFLAEAERKGGIGSILAGINLDTVASGDSLFFLAHPESMRRRAQEAVRRLELQEAFRTVEYLGPVAGSDHYSFLQAGLPAAEILFWPCEVYKLPQDDLDHVDERLIARCVDIAFELANTYEEERS